MTIEEYREKNSNSADSEPDLTEFAFHDPEYYDEDAETYDVLLPESFDWRDHGIVSNVKNQGDCGSCYAQHTLDALGLHMMHGTGKYYDFSVQEIVDCAKTHGTNGCDGGVALGVYSYIKKKGGLSLKENYPYTGMQGVCNENVARMNVSIKVWDDEVDSDADLMKILVSKGPLYVGIDSVHESLLRYSSGIYDDSTIACGRITHALLLVGYGTEHNVDYWILKNSYSESWGENGYLRMARSLDCGIKNFVLYPIIV
jgi:cathepsin L